MLDPLRVTHYGPPLKQSVGRPILIEVAHGATTLNAFLEVRSLLRGSYPDDLADFFLVNTDQGAPELANQIAGLIMTNNPGRTVIVAVATVPRTLIDVNRVPGVTPEAASSGGVTPGLMPYVTDSGDVAILTDLHRRYHLAVGALVDRVCGAGGQMLCLHTYAPRSVDAGMIDERIGERMREAWSGDVSRWPLRPPVDLIGRNEDRTIWLVDPQILQRLRWQLSELGFEVADAASYHLALVTMARHYRDCYPRQVVCLEVRRDLLVKRWNPFVEMTMDYGAIAKIAGALRRALFNNS